jgi:8-oxo-dGTP pyrophosphatase MutT (NUDIX family)
MIRNSYGRSHWTFPGGTVGRRETPDAAAIREVREEVGVSVRTVIPIGIYRTDREYKRDTVHVFRAPVDLDDLKINLREVAEAAWVLPDNVPAHGPVVAAIIDMLREDIKRK